MTKVTLRLVGTLLGTPALFALACGGKSDGDDDQGPSFLEEAQFQELFPSQLCALISSCCNQVSAPISETACRTQATEAVRELAQDGVVYDGAAAAACLNGYTSAFARCALPDSDDLDPCDVVYVGNVPPGGACVSQADCAGRDVYCEPDLTTGALVCVDYSSTSAPPEPAVEGEACGGTCSGDPSGGDCVTTIGPGSPAKTCYVSDGLECDFATGACVPTPGPGEPCVYYCNPGLYCDFNTSLCAPLLADGQPCEYYDECSSGECVNGVCGGTEMITAELCSEF